MKRSREIQSQISVDSDDDDEKGGCKERKIDIQGPMCPLYSRLLHEYVEKQTSVLTHPTTANRMVVNISSQEWPDFFWPDGSPIDAKIAFLKTVGELNTSSDFALIARYILTLVDVNYPGHSAEVIEKMFTNNARLFEESTRRNLLLCMRLNPTHLCGTPFETYNPDMYRNLIEQLANYHHNNVTWGLHMLQAKDDRASRQAIAPISQHSPSLPPPDSQEVRGAIKKKPRQLLLDFLFQRAAAQRMCRADKQMFGPVYTSQGLFTRHYRLECDMEQWIRRQVDEHTYPLHYDTLTKDNATIDYLLKHFNSQPDVRCPFRTTCRTLFSYENGIFDADKCCFYPYNTTDIAFSKNVRPIAAIESGVGTANYFENSIVPLALFASKCNWRSAIQVPNMEKIFKDQDYKEEELEWVQANHGRLLHNVGSHDGWQNATHHKGPPGCGKSVIAKTIKAWYPPEFIGILNDDVEDGFPDAHLVGKFIIMCMDVSEEFGLMPTRFLCWVSADDVSIKRKFLPQISLKWTAPVVFFSNYDPPLAAKGALRRFFICPMQNAVEHTDSTLENKAVAEAPFYLIKCTFAYHEKFRVHGNTSLWDNVSMLPLLFWLARDEFAGASSWPDAFLQSGRLLFDPSFSMSAEEFEREYKFFQASQKRLRGVNNSRRSRNQRDSDRAPPCTPMEFANALKNIRACACRWDKTTNMITGLKIAPALHANDDEKHASQSVTHAAPRPRTITHDKPANKQPEPIYSTRTFETLSQQGVATVL